MKVLVIDNYDSFTYNLVHILRELGLDANMDIVRNDAVDLKKIAAYDKILLSPGPGLPKDAGMMMEVINQFSADKSILGVCLGHQGIAEIFGARLYNMKEVLHGIAKTVAHDQQDPLFSNIPSDFRACRYHSWSVDPASVNGELKIIARDEQGEVMAIKHNTHCVRGVQFHPESILTEYGIKMMENWVKI